MMKKINLLIFALLMFSFGLHAQYLETFSIPNKGILSGPCTGTEGTTCISNDFAGVNWTIEGDLSGIDAEPFATTADGVLSVTDIDEKACWVSPVLNITGASASFSVDLTWLGFNDYNVSSTGSKDFIDVEYRIDGGAWIQLPNAVGGGPRTISYVGAEDVDGSITDLGTAGITGATLQIRVCFDQNSAGEITTLDNVTATGASLPGSGPECDLEITNWTVTDENCPGSNDAGLTITATTTNGPVSYSIAGPVNQTNATGMFTNLPPGNYTISVDDNAFVPGTCTDSAPISIAAGVDNTSPTASDPAVLTVACLSDVPPADPELVIDETDNCTIPCTTEPWINEFHYDNDGTDAGEFIEIAGPAGLDLSIYTIHTYDGADRMVDQVFTLSGTIDDEQNGFGALTFATANLQNQMEGIALVKNGTTLLEFISYEGSFLAIDGPAVGQVSVDVGIEEPSTQASGESLSRIGSGNAGTEFIFADQLATPGSLNTNQTLLACPENLPTVAFQSETDNDGAGSEADPLIITRLYRVTDAAGNFSDVTHLIKVIDTEVPTALCQPALTIELDTVTGIALLSPFEFDMGSTDNCGTVTLGLDRDTLTCMDRGELVLTLLVTDAAGLVSRCTTAVTVTGAEAYCATVGTNDFRNASQDLARLPIYPNPADEGVFLDLSGLEVNTGTMKVLITNTLGQMVYQATIVGNQQQVHFLNTTDFAAGVYYTQIQIGNRPYAVNRLIINH